MSERYDPNAALDELKKQTALLQENNEILLQMSAASIDGGASSTISTQTPPTNPTPPRGSIADELLKMEGKSEYTDDAELIAWGAEVGVTFQPNDKKPNSDAWCGYGLGIAAKRAGYTIPDTYANSQAWLGFGDIVDLKDARKDDIVIYKDPNHVACVIGDADGDGETDVIHCNFSGKIRVTGIMDHCDWCKSKLVAIVRLT